MFFWGIQSLILPTFDPRSFMSSCVNSKKDYVGVIYWTIIGVIKENVRSLGCSSYKPMASVAKR